MSDGLPVGSKHSLKRTDSCHKSGPSAFDCCKHRSTTGLVCWGRLVAAIHLSSRMTNLQLFAAISDYSTTSTGNPGPISCVSARIDLGRYVPVDASGYSRLEARPSICHVSDALIRVASDHHKILIIAA